MNNQLIGLYLSDNELEGELNAKLCNLHSLQALFIDENGFSGNIPSCINVLDQLTQFYAFKNQLTGFVPFEFSSLQSLRKCLSHCSLQLTHVVS